MKPATLQAKVEGLRQENQMKWQQLQQLHEQAVANLSNCTVDDDSKSTSQQFARFVQTELELPSPDISSALIERLSIDLGSNDKTDNSENDEDDEDVQFLVEELVRSFRELQELDSTLELDIHRFKEKLHFWEEMLSEQREIYEGMANMRFSDSVKNGEDQIEQEAECEQMKADLKYILEHMKVTNDPEKWSMDDFIFKLIDRLIESPKNPYLSRLEYPICNEHVDKLLECHIVERMEEDPNAIKLTDYRI